MCVDRRTGLLAPVGDTDRLGDAVMELLQNPGRRESLAERGRRHIEQRFSARAMTDALEVLYRRLADPPK